MIQLEQRLAAAQIELRKLGSERHTLRARLRREADRLRELESALRAERELRAQAADEHYAALGGLRARLAELAAAPPAKVVSGLRQIRGIGPAFERSLELLGVTRVAQIAAWTEADRQAFAQELKIRSERIDKDDWIGQAKRLSSESPD